MKINEIMLTEEPVFSSWIEDLSYNEDENDVLMTLLNDYQYIFHDVDPQTYLDWVSAPSKGRFFHWYIKDNYTYDRIY